MTREEKQKAIDALKISAPVIAMTREEFTDYIQTLNKIMVWLEQEPILDKIRAEIGQNANRLKDSLYGDGLRHAIELIDKYKAESGEE